VSTRLHSSIISTSLGVPTIALEYHPKVRGYFEEINMSFYCVSKIDLVQNKEISKKIDQLVYKSLELKEKLRNGSKLKRKQSYEVLNTTIKEILND
jgi:polysaccharide pyruvyl transferase WcaK-like protein